MVSSEICGKTKILLLISLWAVCKIGYGETLDTITFIQKWRNQFEYAGVYIAKEKGFFESEGLFLKIEKDLNVERQIKKVLERPGVYGVQTSHIVKNRIMGEPIVLLFPLFQHSPVAVMVRANSDIYTPQDLVGKTLVVAQTTYTDLVLMMDNEGLTTDQTTIIHKWDKKKFESGEADGITDYITDVAYRKDLDSVRLIVPLQYGVDLYGECYFTSEVEMREHPQRAEKVREILLKGWEYALQNPDEAAEIINGKYNAQLSIQDLKDEYVELRKLVAPYVVELGHNNPGRWRQMVRKMVELNLLEKEVDLEGFFYEDYVVTSEEWKNITLYAALSFFGLFALIGSVQIVFNYRLRHVVKVQMDSIHKQNMELKKINGELDNFVYRVSHDLRAPISSALGIIDLMRVDNEKGKEEYLSLMEKTMRRLDQFIKDILSYSRNSRTDSILEPVDIREIVNDQVESLKNLAEKNVDATIKITGCDQMEGDPARLNIILNNLVSNAYRYIDIDKEKSEIEILVGCDEKNLNITVTDNGIGIENVHLDKIFNMFYRGTEHKTGSGLGLYIVKETVDKLDGEIKVFSEPGIGTKFEVTLPLCASKA